jgi:hypothetical protein
VLATLLLLFHFLVPFLLLLSRDLKRDARSLARLALVLLGFRLLDLYWLIGPDLAGHGHGHPGPLASFHVLFLTAAAGVGGVWAWAFLRALKDRPLLPVGDPEIRELIARPAGAEAH